MGHYCPLYLKASCEKRIRYILCNFVECGREEVVKIEEKKKITFIQENF